MDEEEFHEGEKAKVLNPHKLEIASSLLCVDADALDEALTTHSSVTRGETIVHNNDVAQVIPSAFFYHHDSSLEEDNGITTNKNIGLALQFPKKFPIFMSRNVS